MKKRAGILLWLSLVLAFITLLVPASLAFAQEDNSGPSGAQMAALGGILLVCGVISLVFYVYFALALQAIAKKTNTENAWWAWIPILNTLLMLNIAKKPLWWFLLLLIPLVNIVIAVIMWMGIFEARGKPGWWVILLFIPLVNLIVLGILAWSN